MKIDITQLKTYYINLDKHISKNEYMKNMLTSNNFADVQRIPGIDMPECTKAGCSRAHYEALDFASKNKEPFLLLEDDCRIKNFRTTIEVPDDADAVYIGISGFGRMNSHSGMCIQYQKINDDVSKILNMLSGHAIIYINDDYIKTCKKICHYSGYILNDYQDIGFAEIQKYFNVYALNDPIFYQTSSEQVTIKKIDEYSTKTIMKYNASEFKPLAIL